jgi:hypothetical protein
MAAETLTASPLAVAATHGLSRTLKVWEGTYEIAANVEDGDIFELGHLPAHCVVIGGIFVADDLDTGTEAMDMDVGWAANGTSSAATWYNTLTGETLTDAGNSASVAGFSNMGVLTGDGIAELHTGNQRIQFYVDPLYFAAKTKVQIEANVAANAGGTGTVRVYLIYYMT